MHEVGGRRDTWRHLPAVAISALFLLPLLVMVMGSLRPAGLPPPRSPELVPSDPTMANYRSAVELGDLAGQFVNSTIVVAVAVPLTVLVASWAGLAISQLPRRAANAMVAVSLVALMVPATALLVGRFTLFGELGLTNTLVPLMAPALVGASPFFVLLFTWSFRRLPPELFDAARLEGAGWLSIWGRVAMPLVRPVTGAVAILAFVVTWGNFLDPLIYLSDPDRYTLPLGLRLLSGLDAPDAPVYLAGAVMATVPVLAVVYLLQRLLFRSHRGWSGR
jgi:multiple sugar transport system permease protein